MPHFLMALLFVFLAPTFVLPAATEAESWPDSWQGIPLMTGHHSGREAGPSYVAVVNVQIEKAETWYRNRMTQDGWSVMVRLRSDKNLIGGGPMVSLDFSREDEEVNVMLLYSVKEEYTIIMLTRISPSKEE